MSYQTSKDYRRLIELLDGGDKIFGYLGNEVFQCYQNSTLGYELESIYEQLENATAAELLKFCEESDVEFIDPADCVLHRKLWRSPEEVPEEGQNIVLVAIGENTALGRFTGISLNWWTVNCGKTDRAVHPKKWCYVKDLEEME